MSLGTLFFLEDDWEGGTKEEFGFLGDPKDGLSPSAFLKDLINIPAMCYERFNPLLLFFKDEKELLCFHFLKAECHENLVFVEKDIKQVHDLLSMPGWLDGSPVAGSG